MLAGTAEVFTVTVPAWILAALAFLGTVLGGEISFAVNGVTGIFCRWTAVRLHSTCYPAFVPALSGWKRKLVRVTGTES